jgi:hypothetical protein
MDIRTFFDENRKQCEKETQLINSMGKVEVEKDAKQIFVDCINEWIGKYADSIEEVKERIKDKDTDYWNKICKTDKVKLTVDGIELDMDIVYILDKFCGEYKPKFSINIRDRHIMSIQNCDEEPLHLHGDGYSFSVEELYERIQKLKSAKYDKMTGQFRVNETKNTKVNELLRSMFDTDKCCVCLDNVGDCETLMCGHYCCRQCRHQMIKKKNKKCPLCRKKNIQFWDNSDSSDEEDDD